MNHRFRLSSGLDLSLQKSTYTGNGLLTEGIFDSNIDTATNGIIRVALWREWRAMTVKPPKDWKKALAKRKKK
jgi:hypothetical protein